MAAPVATKRAADLNEKGYNFGQKRILPRTSIRTPVRCLSLSLDVDISGRAPEEESCRSCIHLDESGCPRRGCGALDDDCSERVALEGTCLDLLTWLSRPRGPKPCRRLEQGGIITKHEQSSCCE